MANTSNRNRSGLNWWYAAHFVYGAIQMVFIPVLIPTFILEVTGSAVDVGIVMGIIGLGALATPIIGGLADKYWAHRTAQLGGLLSLALGGIVFSISGKGDILADLLYVLGAALLGLGSATLLMINPTFIVSGGFPADEEAKRLTRLNQTAIVGSLVAGVGLGALTSAGLSFEVRFLVLAVVALVGFVIALKSNKGAAARIRRAAKQAEKEAAVDQVTPSSNGGKLDQILFSNFGLFLLAVLLLTIGQGAMTGQYPNYMEKVFLVAPSLSASALSVSAIVGLVVLGLLGNWMKRSGPSAVWLMTIIFSALTMVGLILLNLFGTPIAAFLPLGVYVLYQQTISGADMVQPSVAAKASSAGAGMTQGLMLFAVALGYSGGNLLAGFAAETLGFSSFPWIVGTLTILGFILGSLSLSQLRKPVTKSA